MVVVIGGSLTCRKRGMQTGLTCRKHGMQTGRLRKQRHQCTSLRGDFLFGQDAHCPPFHSHVMGVNGLGLSYEWMVNNTFSLRGHVTNKGAGGERLCDIQSQTTQVPTLIAVARFHRADMRHLVTINVSLCHYEISRAEMI